jgi:gamma-glutamyl-gamma-aminobutyrate hydrolase PuuD
VIPVLVSQRVDVVDGRDERRDALDRRLVDVLAECGLLGIPVPNRPDGVVDLWNVVQPQGLVLSGGNDLAAYGGDCPERDDTEWALLDLATANNLPVLGICRGMQAIATYFGGQLEQIEGHVATRHRVHGVLGDFDTNSYHAFSPSLLPLPLQATMHSEDGHIEALRHTTLPIIAIMWHPEREPKLDERDRSMIDNLFDLQSRSLQGAMA